MTKQPIDVGSDRHLPIDDMFFDRNDNVKLAMRRPEIKEPVLASDMQWAREGVIDSTSKCLYHLRHHEWRVLWRPPV